MARENPNIIEQRERGAAGTSVEELKERAAREARELAEKTEATVRSRAEAKRKDAALTLTTLATTLLQSGVQLRDEQQAVAGEYVERAAKQVERAAQYVERADLAEMVDNLETFARRRPALFIGAAFAVGLLGARFIKSSRRNLVESEQTTRPQFSDREVQTSRSVERVGSQVPGAL